MPVTGTAQWNGETITWLFDGSGVGGEPGIYTAGGTGQQALGSNLPAGIGAPSHIGSIYADRGTVRFTSSKPFWANSVLFFVDVDFYENSDLKFYDCGGQPVDAGGFDFLKISTINANTPTYQIQGTAPARYWTITPTVVSDPSTVNGLIIRSNQVCQVEITTMRRPGEAKGGGTNFFLGSPPNQKPVAVPTLGGTPAVGATITGSYTYADAESEPEDRTSKGTQYKWVTSATDTIASSAAGTTVATGATGGAGNSVTYTLQPADKGRYLFYCVTPAAASGASPGLEVCTAATGPVREAAPQAVPSLSGSGVLGLGAAMALLGGLGWRRRRGQH